jgi:triacylglycerol lipase
MLKRLPADTWKNLFYPPAEYQYFESSERFDFEPDAAGFSWRNAWWLADAALLAYVKDWNLVKASLERAQFDSVRQVGPDPSKSTKGFFAVRSRPLPFAIMAFRGTDKDDPRNAESDETIGPLEREGYSVHEGFALALDEVWETEVKPSIDDFMQAFPNASIYFTGHSLGAALATIAVTRFPGNKCALYTIGSPRVGDDRFTRAVLQKTELVFRFVNCQDIVTQIPTEILLRHYFRHVGEEKYIDRNAKVLDHPSEFDKFADVAQGIIAHDGPAELKEIGHPADFFWRLRKTEPYVDPPPFIVGNHTPARYSIHIWNHYAKILNLI